MEEQSEILVEKIVSTKEFKVEELNKALFDFEDLMERCLSPFLLLGSTAKDIKDGFMLRGNKVEVGIQEQDITPEMISTIETYKGDTISRGMKKWTYLVDEVPVEVKIIKRKYSFFKNPEMIFYWGGDYQLPNPMTDYMKAQYVIH